MISLRERNKDSASAATHRGRGVNIQKAAGDGTGHTETEKSTLEQGFAFTHTLSPLPASSRAAWGDVGPLQGILVAKQQVLLSWACFHRHKDWP